MVYKVYLFEDQLGKVPDSQIAKEYGLSRNAVCTIRNKKGIPPYVPQNKRRIEWSDELKEDLYNPLLSSREVASKHFMSSQTVNRWRKKLNVKTKFSHVTWTPDMIAYLGTMSDHKVAKKLGIPRKSVMRKRISLGIKNSLEPQKQ